MRIITGTLYGDPFLFTVKPLWVFFIMRNVLEQKCRENQNTHFVFDKIFTKIVPFMR